MWYDIAMIVFSATLANHMGLVEAIEGVIRHKIPVLNCSKCLSFWSVLLYGLFSGIRVIPSVAISFLCAFVAVWFALSLGLIDKLYNDVYQDSFASEAASAEAADTEDTETDVS